MTRPVGRPPLGRPGPGQAELIGLPAPPPGVVEAAVDAQLAAAVEAGQLDDRDDTLAALARKVAAAVDRADAAGETRAVVSASRELASLLAQLGLTRSRPAPAKEEGRPDVAAFLATLGTPSLGDASQP